MTLQLGFTVLEKAELIAADLNLVSFYPKAISQKVLFPYLIDLPCLFDRTNSHQVLENTVIKVEVQLLG